MTADVRGRIIVITGAGSVIGEALAGRFRQDGALVAGCDLPHALEAAGVACDLAVAADVTNSEEMNAFAAQVVDRFGRVDALVTLPSGGRSGRTFFEEQDYPMFSRFSSQE